MKTIEIKVDDKTFKIREFLAIEVDAIDFTDAKKATREQLKLALGITDIEYDKLTFRERLTIQKEVNQLNGVQDFQKPTA